MIPTYLKQKKRFLYVSQLLSSLLLLSKRNFNKDVDAFYHRTLLISFTRTSYLIEVRSQNLIDMYRLGSKVKGENWKKDLMLFSEAFNERVKWNQSCV